MTTDEQRRAVAALESIAAALIRIADAVEKGAAIDLSLTIEEPKK